jgi:hypothetical protein
MSKSRALLIAATAVLACAAFSAHAADTVFRASLDGAQNLPEPVKTPAYGTVEMRLSADGKSLQYKVTVEKITNVNAADLHLGSAAQNGPLVAKLWPKAGGAAKKGEFSGTLVEGTLDGGDLVGPLGGSPLADLVEQLREGSVYVNLHTSDGSNPPESGPGDHRQGEIRGQLK